MLENEVPNGVFMGNEIPYDRGLIVIRRSVSPIETLGNIDPFIRLQRKQLESIRIASGKSSNTVFFGF